ncbi:MAG: ABC transporter ATP-binding protein [Deltaproteobacteria bacterium]|nr:ABC transporter ATP-binding protein [Deltaproteobacteria bacterium]
MLLSVKNLHVKYGNIEALHGISFDIDEGEIVTLIGANGAGKSTTLHTITRLPPPDGPRVTEGEILFKGQSILKIPAHKIVSDLHITLAPEGRHIFGNLTVLENLTLATYARKDRDNIPKDLQRVFELFPRLEERRKQRSESLSGGEQQMLAVGRAFMSGGRILLLDEPSMGLAPLLMYEKFRTLKRLNQEEGITILLVEQNARIALQFAHRGYVLDTGEIVAQGSSAQLTNDPDVKKAYLGG